jgi:hypothetical protein
MHRAVREEKGNALFLILIAVALFAALSYAVSKSGTGSGNISKEQTGIAAAQIIEYAGEVEQAVNRLTLAGGCATTDLRFYSTRFTNPAVFGAAPNATTEKCYIFYPNGGNIEWRPPPALARDPAGPEYMYTEGLQILGVGRWGISPSGPYSELTMLAIVTKDVCDEINRRVGTPGAPLTTTVQAGGHADFAIPDGLSFTGSFAAWPWAYIGDSGDPNFASAFFGKTTGCYYQAGVQKYYFFHVLVAQ